MSQQFETPLGGTTNSVIAHHFGRWTAYSALRSGRHIKSRDRVLSALDAVCFTHLFNQNLGEIGEPDFDAWHKDAVKVMCRHIRPNRQERFHAGHAAKAIAVYLKTVCYLGGHGRPGLAQVMHPPFDKASMEVMGIAGNAFPAHFPYEEHEKRVLQARQIARQKGCSPIELEMYWRPDPAS